MFVCWNFRKICRVLIIITAALCLGGIILLVIRERPAISAAEKDEPPVALPVIMYHSVHGSQPSEYVVTPEQLRSDLEWLQKNGYTSVSASQLIDYTRGHGELPEKPVLITFDDGFYNNLSLALPLLEEFDMQAIVSIVGRYTDSVAPKDPHYDAYSYLTWEDVELLADSGRVEIGSHTYDMHCGNGIRHGCAKIGSESEEEYHKLLLDDLMIMQLETKRCTGITPVVFAYPFGYICRESVPVMRDCGFLVTLTCYERMNYIERDEKCLLGLSRYNRSGNYTTAEFMSKIKL